MLFYQSLFKTWQLPSLLFQECIFHHTASPNTAQPGPFSISFIFLKRWFKHGRYALHLNYAAPVCLAAWVSQPSHHSQVQVCSHSAMSSPVNIRSIQGVKHINEFVKRFPSGCYRLTDFSNLLLTIMYSHQLLASLSVLQLYFIVTVDLVLLSNLGFSLVYSVSTQNERNIKPTLFYFTIITFLC